MRKYKQPGSAINGKSNKIRCHMSEDSFKFWIVMPDA